MADLRQIDRDTVRRFVTQLLGRRPSEGPTSGSLAAEIAGSDAPSAEVAELLLRQPRLRAALEAGIEEARLLQHRPWGEQTGHRPLPIEVPPRRIAAASATQPPELPADRQVLLEQHGRFRLVYYRLGEQAHLGCFSGLASVGIKWCRLDQRDLPLSEPTADAVIVGLGPAAALPGARVALALSVGDETVELSWTFVGSDERAAQAARPPLGSGQMP